MKKLATLMLLVVLLSVVGGCTGSDDDGLDPKEVKAASRVEQIAKSSGGDWSKVSEADKKYLVEEISMGSEQSAKMLIMSKSGSLRASPGGAHSGGPPSGK